MKKFRITAIPKKLEGGSPEDDKVEILKEQLNPKSSFNVPRTDSWGFLEVQRDEPNVVGGLGVNFPKGLGLNFTGVLPIQSDPVFKGTGEFGVNQQFGNLNLGAKIGTPVLKDYFTRELIIDPELSLTGRYTIPYTDKKRLKGKVLKKGGVIKIPKKHLGGQYNRRVLNDLDRYLMDPYSSKKYSKSLAATNSVFAVNDLFKKPSRSRIYNPNAKYLQEGGELPKHNIRGIVKSATKNPVTKKFLRYMDGVNRGANEILSNPLSSRKFSEIFPITQAQKIASDNLQREAIFKGDDFVKQWVYGKGPSTSQTDIPYIPRAGVEKKIQDIFLSLDQPTTGPLPGPYAGLDLGKFHDNFLIHHGYPQERSKALTYNKDNPFVSQGLPYLIGSEIFNSKRAQELIPKIGQYGVNYLQDNYDNIGGVNLSAGPSITLKDRGPYRLDPKTLEEVGAHEAGHTMQKLGYYINSSQQPMGWDQVIEKWNPDLKLPSGKKKGYNEANPDTALGRRFKDAMVEGKYWKSSPSELHSELMVSRMNAFNAMKEDPAYANFSNDQIMEIMQLDEPEMLKYIYDTPSSYGTSLSRFFKEETPLQERLDLLKLLPGLATPFVLPGLMDDNKPKLQDGGLPKHNLRGIVKTGKNLANEIAIGNTIFPGWRSPVNPTLHHRELLENLGRKGLFKQFENIKQSELNPFTETLIADYAQNSGPYKMRKDTQGTIGDSTVNWSEPDPSAPWKVPDVFDPNRKKLLMEQILDKSRDVEVPKETLFTRVVNRTDPNLLNIENGVIRVGDNLNSFTVGPASNIISGGPNTDRFVLTGKNLKGYEKNFLKNTYPTLTSEHAELAAEHLFPIVNQGFGSGSIKDINSIMNQLQKEREAIFTGADLKIKYKVKNDRGGYDYIVRPVPLGYTTPNYEKLLKNPYLRTGLGVGAGTLMLGSDKDEKDKKIGGVIKISKSKLNKFKH